MSNVLSTPIYLQSCLCYIRYINLITDINNPFCDTLIQISVALSCVSMTYELECNIFISTVLSQTWQRSNLTKKTEMMTTQWWLQPHLQAPEN